MEIVREDEVDIEHFGQSDPYRLELEEFAATIREGREPAVGPDEILGNARAVEALLQSARSGGNAREI
jgi:predicted dehydrogenase